MKFTAGLAQMSPTLGDLEANRKRALAVARKALRRGVELLIFPELALAGYFLGDIVPDVAQHRRSPLLEELKAISRDMALVVGFVEESPAHIFYNAAAYYEGGRLVHCHRKVYLFTYGMSDEQRYLGPGRAVRAFDTRFGRAAILICEDAWHPSLAYLASQDGADLLFIPSASPGRGVRPGRGRLGIQERWRAINRCYAATFSQFVFFANRVGYEDGINFWGGSEIVGPDGDAVASAPLFKEALLIAQVDTSEVRRARIAGPTLRDEDLHLTLRELSRLGRKQEA